MSSPPTFFLPCTRYIAIVLSYLTMVKTVLAKYPCVQSTRHIFRFISFSMETGDGLHTVEAIIGPQWPGLGVRRETSKSITLQRMEMCSSWDGIVQQKVQAP